MRKLHKKGLSTWSTIGGALLFIVILFVSISIYGKQYGDRADDISKFGTCENIQGVKSKCVESENECDSLNGYSYSPNTLDCPPKEEKEKKICCAYS
ncbi:MAG: hypothetical protein KKF89_05260 [Nanoarchaeota archaeon]|nr:hypothetical protein [Nanoarchaeota archaeon]MBU1855103.1 hypothetical protein [Nanoarchaeota archaeon]